MKVAVHLDGPAVQGNERQMVLVAACLVARGHRVVASCRAGGPVAEAFAREGIPTTGARPRGDADAWNALRFAAWLRRERPDALLLTSWKRAFVAGWAARVARVPRVVLRVGGTHRIEPGWEGWKRRRALLRYVDAVVSNSRVVTERLAGGVPGLRGRIWEVPNGIAFAPMPPAPLREELGIAPGALLVAGVGVLTHGKGFDLLLDAVARTGDEGLHVVLAGEGPARGALLARAASLGLGDRLHLLGHRADVPAVLAACDVLAVASRAEGMSVAMMEAMTARRPVVSAEVGGVWEALAGRAGRAAAGWIVPREDAGALSAALMEVAADLRAGGDEVRRRVAEARWRVDHWFTVERMIDGVEAALRGEPFDHVAPGAAAEGGEP